MLIGTTLIWEKGMPENLKSDYIEILNTYSVDAIKNFLIENPISIAFTIVMSFAILSLMSLVSTYFKQFNK